MGRRYSVRHGYTLEIMRLSRNKKPVPKRFCFRSGALGERGVGAVEGTGIEKKGSYPCGCPTLSARMFGVSDAPPSGLNAYHPKNQLIMTPNSKQVDEVSEVLAFLLDDFTEEAPQEESVPATEGGEPLNEAALARVVAKSLSANSGDACLRSLLGAVRGILRGALEVQRAPRGLVPNGMGMRAPLGRN